MVRRLREGGQVTRTVGRASGALSAGRAPPSTGGAWAGAHGRRAGSCAWARAHESVRATAHVADCRVHFLSARLVRKNKLLKEVQRKRQVRVCGASGLEQIGDVSACDGVFSADSCAVAGRVGSYCACQVWSTTLGGLSGVVPVLQVDALLGFMGARTSGMVTPATIYSRCYRGSVGCRA